MMVFIVRREWYTHRSLFHNHIHLSLSLSLLLFIRHSYETKSKAKWNSASESTKSLTIIIYAVGESSIIFPQRKIIERLLT